MVQVIVKDYTQGGILVRAFLTKQKDKDGVVKTYISYEKR